VENITKKITFDSAKLPTISVCMIVKNEEKNLPKILGILKDSVEEIIIVDTGSTDSTVKIAESFGAKVYHFPWNDNFSDARNESLKYATMQNVLWLDGDDNISKQDIIKLKFHIQSHPNTAVFLKLLDKRPAREFHSIQLRAFPNNLGIVFKGRIHEQASFSVEEKNIKYSKADISIIHLGYDTEESIVAKLTRNIILLKKDLEENPDDFLTNLHTAKTYLGLSKFKEAKPYSKKACDMALNKQTGLSKESSFLAVLGEVTILSTENKTEEALKLMEKSKPIFPNLKIIDLTLGEMYFRKKDYMSAYKNLLVMKTGGLDIGLMPVDFEKMLKSLKTFLMVSSLAVGDFETAEQSIRGIISDADFCIKREDI
jgi:glycosyltransferase involved in cell wall biosynthesis